MSVEYDEETAIYELLSQPGQFMEDAEQVRIMYRLLDIRPHCAFGYTWDDIGTATLIADIFKDSIKYCPQYGAWYIWNGCWERQEDNGFIFDKIQNLLNVLHLYCSEMESEPHKEDMTEYRKYVKSLRKNVAMKNIAEVLKTMVRVAAKDLDTDPYILNTPAAAYDLRTGAEVENIRDYNVTMKTTCSLPYDAVPVCHRWYQFIDEIMDGDKEKAAFLQRALGYSLLGVNREECAFVAYGFSTRNGKGTLFKTIEAVLGDGYSATASAELVCELAYGKQRDFNAPQPTLAKLVGTRFVDMSETSQNARLDAAAVKSMTGRDTLTTRGLYEAPFSFTPQFTMWLMTNHLPAVSDDSVFASNRLWVIEFPKHFDENTQDKDLKELFQLPHNRPTILGWLYDGCRDYLQIGLQVPESVRTATANYRITHDRIGCFINECCTINPDEKVKRGDLYLAYQKWCVKPEYRYKPLGSTTFYKEFEVRGYPVRKISEYYVMGLTLTTQ